MKLRWYLCKRCIEEAKAIRRRWVALCEMEKTINQTPPILRRVVRTGAVLATRGDDK